MWSTTTIIKICRGLILVMALLALAPLMPAQAAESGLLTSRFVARQTLRYEVEGAVHFTSNHAPNVKLNILPECSYRLRSVLKLKFASSEKGTFSGHVYFESPNFEAWQCGNPPRPELVQALHNLEINGMEFQISPAGDVHLKDLNAVGVEYEGVNMLVKSAWGLLQTHLSDRAISAGPAWISTRRFLYWPDTFMEGMEVAAASMHYPQDVTVGSGPYAWLQYKQVFSPVDIPAYVETRTRARDFSGTTFVTGKGDVSLLFDTVAGRIVFLHHSRVIDNRMMLKYESSDTKTPIATYEVSEESSARWLPEKEAEAWLAALHKFETQPASSGPAPLPAGEPGAEPSLGQLAATAKRVQPGVNEERDLSDLIDRAPRGFERWTQDYCSDAYCFTLSLAIPQGTKVADATATTVLLLDKANAGTVSVALGPALDVQYSGLRDEEMLRKQTTNVITNYLWFAGGSGQKLNFERGSLGDRPAAFSDFSAVARDLSPIHGRLVLVLTPFNRLLPIACSYPASQQDSLDAICQTVTGSILIR